MEKTGWTIHSFFLALRSEKSFTLDVITSGQIGIFGRSKYGQVACPWKDLAKCSSDGLVLGQKDPPVKSYDQIKFLADFPIVITM